MYDYYGGLWCHSLTCAIKPFVLGPLADQAVPRHRDEDLLLLLPGEALLLVRPAQLLQGPHVLMDVFTTERERQSEREKQTERERQREREE